VPASAAFTKRTAVPDFWAANSACRRGFARPD
jgi:hypothetical protein